MNPGVSTIAIPLSLLPTGALVGALLLLPARAQAQSLAEIAAKERERRKALGKTSRTITEEDLGMRRPKGDDGPAKPPLPAAPAVATPSVETAEEPEQQSVEEEREDRLDVWNQMLENARQDVARLSAEVDRLEASLSSLSGLYGRGRAERMGQLEKAKQDLAAFRRVVEEMELEGRRQGFR